MAGTTLQSAKIVIVGCGLAGYTTAAALAQAGCNNVVVYDSRDDPTMFETDRAYSLVIYRNGQRLLNKLDGFDQIFKKDAFCQHVRVVNRITADAKQEIITSRPASGPVYWLLKSRCLQLLDAYVRERYPHVKLVTNTTVQDVLFERDGTQLLTSSADGKSEKVAVDLLIACDGSNSTIRKLMAVHDDEIESVNGMGMYSKESPATGIRHKGIVLNSMPIISAPNEPTQYAQPSVIYYIYGQRRGRASERVFDIMLLPVCSGTNVQRRAALSVEDGHHVLSVQSVEEAFALFRENFPQLRVDEVFSAEEMRRFVETRASAFPPIQRPNSLVGHFRRSGGEGGVMFIGDSAHSFPPDTAQGVNCAFQDVQHLLELVSELGEKASVREVLREYERRRDKECWTLTQLCQVAAPYSYRHNSAAGFARYMLNKRVRRALSNVAPALFSEDLDTLIRQGLTYGEVRRRNRLTTAALSLLAAAAIAVPVAAAAAACQTASQPYGTD